MCKLRIFLSRMFFCDFQHQPEIIKFFFLFLLSSISYTLDPAPIKPVEVIEKLGDLSKIDISDAVTKLLSSISQSNAALTTPSTSTAVPPSPRDPRQTTTTTTDNTTSSLSLSPKPVINDPRRARMLATMKTEPRLSIYEQGGLSVAEMNRDVDLRIAEKDLDLRGANFGDTDLRSSEYFKLSA